MELYQLRSFVEVAELGHLTRAADKLHVSQPALSAQIKALEEELELELFERTSSGMTLTAAGKRLVGEAQKLLLAAQSLRNEARTIKGEVVGVARVGTLSDPKLIRVGELMSAAVERYPRIEIQLHHEVTGAAFEKVREGDLDASFYYGKLSHPGVAAVALRDLTYRIVAPAAWKQRLEHATWKDVAAEPWVMTPPISTHNELANTLFQQHDIAPTKVLEADDGTAGAYAHLCRCHWRESHPRAFQIGRRQNCQRHRLPCRRTAARPHAARQSRPRHARGG